MNGSEQSAVATSAVLNVLHALEAMLQKLDIALQNDILLPSLTLLHLHRKLVLRINLVLNDLCRHIFFTQWFHFKFLLSELGVVSLRPEEVVNAILEQSRFCFLVRDCRCKLFLIKHPDRQLISMKPYLKHSFIQLRLNLHCIVEDRLVAIIIFRRRLDEHLYRLIIVIVDLLHRIFYYHSLCIDHLGHDKLFLHDA